MAPDKNRGREKGLWERIQGQLKAHGIDLAVLGTTEASWVKVVCIGANLQESVEELGKKTRDQVVMVRIDAETSKELDRWVESGAVKSRSESAALFIREGLKVRAGELESLSEALQEVEKAREHLKRKVHKLFGDESKEV